MRRTIMQLGLSMLTVLGGVVSAETPEPARSPYAGQQAREIKSLSAEDVDDLLRGRGWGLAKAAELNGVPGPLHVLELKDVLGLTAEQTAKIEQVYDRMHGEAIRLGRRLVEQERALDRVFAEQELTEDRLKRMLEEIASTLGDLRYVHLVAHLRTLPLLTSVQAEAYVRLRGYTDGDPCETVPAGHDPAMWKRHHGCDESG